MLLALRSLWETRAVVVVIPPAEGAGGGAYPPSYTHPRVARTTRYVHHYSPRLAASRQTSWTPRQSDAMARINAWLVNHPDTHIETELELVDLGVLDPEELLAMIG